MDVTKFDNAVLNHQDRVLLLRYLSNMIIGDFKTPIQSIYFFRWVYQRHILLSSMNLLIPIGIHPTHITLENLIFELFPLNASVLETIKCSSDSRPFPSLIKSLKKCCNLKNLSFLQNDISDLKLLFEVPTFCSKLEVIEIDKCATNEVLSNITSFCPNLYTIYIGNKYKVTQDKLIEFLIQTGSRLKSITLRSERRGEWPASVAMCIAKNCPLLCKLEGDIELTDTELIAFGKQCPLLSDFCLTDPQGWTDVGIVALAEGCPRLSLIWFNSECDITDVSVVKLTESCVYLQDLAFARIPNLTDDSLLAIGQNCKNLKFFSVAFLDGISSAGWKNLFSSPIMKRLEYVHLKSINITDDCILELVKNSNVSLRGLHIFCSPDITDVGMLYISQFSTFLTVLSLQQLPCVSHPSYLAEILKRNPKLVELNCQSLGPQHRIADSECILVPMLMSLLEENRKNFN